MKNKCLYCGCESEKELHFMCENCEVGMCEECYDADQEHHEHINVEHSDLSKQKEVYLL